MVGGRSPHVPPLDRCGSVSDCCSEGSLWPTLLEHAAAHETSLQPGTHPPPPPLSLCSLLPLNLWIKDIMDIDGVLIKRCPLFGGTANHISITMGQSQVPLIQRILFQNLLYMVVTL